MKMQESIENINMIVMLFHSTNLLELKSSCKQHLK